MPKGPFCQIRAEIYNLLSYSHLSVGGRRKQVENEPHIIVIAFRVYNEKNGIECNRIE